MTNNHLNEIEPDFNYFRGFETSDWNESINYKYYAIAEYNNIWNNHDQLLVIKYNIRSFYEHVDDFLSMMQNPRSCPNELVLTETGFSKVYTETLNTYSSFHSFTPNQRFGGVYVLIKNVFVSRFINEFSFVNDNIECVCCWN